MPTTEMQAFSKEEVDKILAEECEEFDEAFDSVATRSFSSPSPLAVDTSHLLSATELSEDNGGQSLQSAFASLHGAALSNPDASLQNDLMNLKHQDDESVTTSSEETSTGMTAKKRQLLEMNRRHQENVRKVTIVSGIIAQRLLYMRLSCEKLLSQGRAVLSHFPLLPKLKEGRLTAAGEVCPGREVLRTFLLWFVSCFQIHGHARLITRVHPSFPSTTETAIPGMNRCFHDSLDSDVLLRILEQMEQRFQEKTSNAKTRNPIQNADNGEKKSQITVGPSQLTALFFILLKALQWPVRILHALDVPDYPKTMYRYDENSEVKDRHPNIVYVKPKSSPNNASNALSNCPYGPPTVMTLPVLRQYVGIKFWVEVFVSTPAGPTLPNSHDSLIAIHPISYSRMTSVPLPGQWTMVDPTRLWISAPLNIAQHRPASRPLLCVIACGSKYEAISGPGVEGLLPFDEGSSNTDLSSSVKRDSNEPLTLFYNRKTNTINVAPTTLLYKKRFHWLEQLDATAKYTSDPSTIGKARSTVFTGFDSPLFLPLIVTTFVRQEIKMRRRLLHRLYRLRGISAEENRRNNRSTALQSNSSKGNHSCLYCYPTLSKYGGCNTFSSKFLANNSSTTSSSIDLTSSTPLSVRMCRIPCQHCVGRTKQRACTLFPRPFVLSSFLPSRPFPSHNPMLLLQTPDTADPYPQWKGTAFSNSPATRSSNVETATSTKLDESAQPNTTSNADTALPNSLQGFKTSDVYVLYSTLKKNETLHVDAKPVGYWKKQRVFLRADVRPMYTRWQWLKQGRIIAPEEIAKPVFTFRRSIPMRNFSRGDAGSGNGSGMHAAMMHMPVFDFKRGGKHARAARQFNEPGAKGKEAWETEHSVDDFSDVITSRILSKNVNKQSQSSEKFPEEIKPTPSTKDPFQVAANDALSLKVEDPDEVRMYGDWQTLPYPRKTHLPGDTFPINQYSKMDVFHPDMVPIGLRHIDHPYAKKAVALEGVQGVAATVDFTRKGMYTTSVDRGMVVLEADAERVLLRADLLKKEKEDADQLKRTTAILQRWKKLVSKMLTWQRIQREYGQGTEDNQVHVTVYQKQNFDREPRGNNLPSKNVSLGASKEMSTNARKRQAPAKRDRFIVSSDESDESSGEEMKDVLDAVSSEEEFFNSSSDGDSDSEGNSPILPAKRRMTRQYARSLSSRNVECIDASEVTVEIVQGVEKVSQKRGRKNSTSSNRKAASNVIDVESD